MAIPLVPGPAPVWVALNSGAGAGVPRFLGFSERGVSLELTPHWKPYFCDLGGESPLDLSYQGQSATVHVDLVRWNPEVLVLLEDYVLAVQQGSTMGTDVPGEIGSLMSFENLASTMWVRFPYPAGGMAAYARHVPGYRFPAVVIDREGLPERGAKPAKVSLTFRAIRQLNMTPATAGPAGAGVLTLYDFNMAAVNGLFPD